jgi:nanoRNase/pAp phosphatase (c-di-AMP/oligoRNAs hydrolase)
VITEQARDRFAAFSEYVRSRQGAGRWLVLMHDNPDPDALAAAALLASVLRGAFRRRVTIAHGGIIGRAENREMVRALGVRLTHVRKVIWKNCRHVALVDTQPRTGNNQLPDTRIPDVIIDHHPLRKASQAAALTDVRIGYGATTSICAEYLVLAGIEPTARLATSLVYALRSETQDFSRGASQGPDKELYDRFLPIVDKRLLAKILYPRLPHGYFVNLRQGLENLESAGNLIVSHLGTLEQPDIVPEIADLLLRMEGKTWSLATGVHGERVYLSIRTSNPRADAGRIMRRVLGRRGKGGGHGMMAGGWVPVAKAPGGDVLTLQRQLAARLATLLKKNPERLEPLDLGQA